MATAREIEEVKNLFRQASFFEINAESDESEARRVIYARKSEATYRAMNRAMRFFGVTFADIRGESEQVGEINGI